MQKLKKIYWLATKRVQIKITEICNQSKDEVFVARNVMFNDFETKKNRVDFITRKIPSESREVVEQPVMQEFEENLQDNFTEELQSLEETHEIHQTREVTNDQNESCESM